MDQVLEHFFSGSTLVAVDAKGRLSVPASIRQKIERRSDTRALVLTRHPDEPCLAGFDTNYLAFLHAENLQRRSEELSRLLVRHVGELRADKTDRATLAALFNELALRLHNEPPGPAPGQHE